MSALNDRPVDSASRGAGNVVHVISSRYTDCKHRSSRLPDTQMPSKATSAPARNQALLDPDPRTDASRKEYEGPQALMLALQERYNLEHQQEATRSMMASPPFVT